MISVAIPSRLSCVLWFQALQKRWFLIPNHNKGFAIVSGFTSAEETDTDSDSQKGGASEPAKLGFQDLLKWPPYSVSESVSDSSRGLEPEHEAAPSLRFGISAAPQEIDTDSDSH